MMNWSKEKEYCAHRATQLGAEMDAAIEACDKERFDIAWQKSLRYMGKKERSRYYKRFMIAMLNNPDYRAQLDAACGRA